MPCQSHPDLATVIHATLTLRLNYHNSLYVDLTMRLTWKPQLVQNAADLVLTGC